MAGSIPARDTIPTQCWDRKREREMSVYRFTFEMVLDVEGETREDALATAYGVLQEESPELVDWEELDAPVRCDECGEPCDGNDAVTDGNIALCGSFYGNGCADRAVWRGDLIVGIDGKEW